MHSGSSTDGGSEISALPAQPGKVGFSQHSNNDSSRRPPLDWAVFLGTSWTWCIGMFLPVLVIRDFGAAGWICFALPNVVGAAAMGWVLRSEDDSRRMTDAHGEACGAFSAVTVLFHLFFIAWVIQGLAGSWVACCAVPMIAAVFLLAGRNKPVVGLAWLVWCISVLTFGVAVARMGLNPHAEGGTLRWGGALPPIGNLGLAAVCCFGLVLDPYLDLTFHRARQHTGLHGARRAFGLGFGIVFLLMIVYTLWYAPSLRPTGWLALATPLRWLIVTHLLVQASFTTGLHTQAMLAPSPAVRRGAAIGLVAGALLILAWVFGLLPVVPGKTSGEVAYWLFMGFYALAFPGYVLFCMMPDRGDRSFAVRHRLIAAAVAAVAAFPMLWVGFLHGRMLWALAGVVLMIAIRLTVLGFPSRQFATIDRSDQSRDRKGAVE